jgi:nucleoid DNA-binding protein
MKRKKDDLMMQVISEVARDLNLSDAKVQYCVDHFFIWLRDELVQMEKMEYKIRGFGTFKVLPKKIKKEQLKQLTNKTENNVKQEKQTDKNENT